MTQRKQQSISEQYLRDEERKDFLLHFDRDFISGLLDTLEIVECSNSELKKAIANKVGFEWTPKQSESLKRVMSELDIDKSEIIALLRERAQKKKEESKIVQNDTSE